MSPQVSGLFSDPTFLGTYILGLFIIILYAKDKFNMPTYDRAAMGPFAQLPPQSLTMDQRYRHGRSIYVFALFCLYTAICVVGPNTFPSVYSALTSAGGQIPFGPQTGGNQQIWPVIAATFLISTGASHDGSILGKIEYFIRQYAHKTAYIPRTVRDLARYFREIDGIQWMVEPQRQEERDERRNNLTTLTGKGAVKEFETKKGESGGELIRWIRANILFYTLQRLFQKKVETVEGRLDELTDLAANNEILAGLTGAQRKLHDELIDAQGNFQPGKGEAARFTKDVSLMLAVLLSQGARNQTELDDYIKRLGLAEIHFHPSDSSAFVTAVNVFMFIGVTFAGIIISAGYASKLREFFDLTGAATSRDLSELARSVDIYPWLSVMINATLSYLIASRLLVYCRDAAMESREWTESFGSRFRVVAIASGVSSIVSVVAIILLFSVIDKLNYVIDSAGSFAYLLILQFALSLLLSTFGLAYLHFAPNLPFARHLTNKSSSSLSGLQICMSHPLPWAHAVMAAILVAIVSQLTLANVRAAILTSLGQSYDNAATAILSSQDFIKKAGAESTITSLWDDLRRTPQGPIQDINHSSTADEKLPDCRPGEKNGRDQTNTDQSVCLVTKICKDLNVIHLSSPPPPSTPQPNCESPTGANTGNTPTPSAAPAPPAPTIPFTLFKDAKTCSPNNRGTIQCEEISFLGLGVALTQYYQILNSFDSFYRGSRHFATTIVPSITAFLVAYAFGVGCLFFRAGWLREGIEEPQGKMLIKEIDKHYDLDEADIQTALAIPLKQIGGLTPLEALRYEEFSIKLFDVIKDKKNRVQEFLALKRSGRAHR